MHGLGEERKTRTMSRQRTDESGSQCIHSEEMEITDIED